MHKYKHNNTNKDFGTTAAPERRFPTHSSFSLRNPQRRSFGGKKKKDKKRGLKQLRKPMQLQTIRDAVREAKARGIRANGFFMIGFPWEDRQQAQATVDFALNLALRACHSYRSTSFHASRMSTQSSAPIVASLTSQTDNRRSCVAFVAAAVRCGSGPRADARGNALAISELTVWCVVAARNPSCAVARDVRHRQTINRRSCGSGPRAIAEVR